MIAEHFAQRALQQMGRRMVLTDIFTVGSINRQLRSFLHLDRAGNDLTDVSDPSAGDLYRLLHLKAAALGADDTGIALLTAHGCVERSLRRDDCSVLARLQGIGQICLVCNGKNLCVCRQCIVSDKFAGQPGIQCVKHACARRIQLCGEILSLSRLLLLLFHGSLKARLVDLKAFLPRQLDRQLDREAEGIIEIECRLSVDILLILSALLLKNLVKFLHAVFQRALKTCNLFLQLRENELPVLL